MPWWKRTDPLETFKMKGAHLLLHLAGRGHRAVGEGRRSHPSRSGCRPRSTSSRRRKRRPAMREDKGLPPAAKRNWPWCSTGRTQSLLCSQPEIWDTKAWITRAHNINTDRMRKLNINFILCAVKKWNNECRWLRCLRSCDLSDTAGCAISSKSLQTREAEPAPFRHRKVCRWHSRTTKLLFKISPIGCYFSKYTQNPFLWVDISLNGSSILSYYCIYCIKATEVGIEVMWAVRSQPP